MVNEPEARPRIGRPRRSPEEGVRIQQALRVRPKIDEQIRASAEKNFRSISEELESRIDQSFECIVVNTKDDALRDKIMASARQNCRSEIAEAENRLRNSFVIESVFGDRDLHAILMLIASDLCEHEKAIGVSWKEADEKTGGRISDAVGKIAKRRFGQHMATLKRRSKYLSDYERYKEEESINTYQVGQFRP